KMDTTKARHYLEIAQIYRLSEPTQNNVYTEKAKKIYLKYEDTTGIAAAYRNKYAYFFTIGQLDSANYYLKESISMYLLSKDMLNAAKLQYNMAYQAISSGRLTEGEDIIEKVTPVYVRYNDSISLGRTYMLSGIIAGTRGYANIALSEYFKSLKIYRAKNEKNRIAEALFAIADEYLQTKQYQKAIAFFEENISLSKEVNIQFYVAQSLNYIGRSYTQLGELDKAEENLTQALELSQQLAFQYNIGKTYLNLGDLEVKKKNYEQAQEYLKQGRKIFKAMGIPNDESVAWVNLGLIEIEKGNYDAAIQNFDASLAMGKNIDDTDVIRDALYYKSIALEGKGDIKKALDLYKESKVLSDSIFNLENSKKTRELQIMFETERKEQQIALQDQEINLLEEKAKVSNLQKWLLGGGLGLSLLLVGFGFY
ncbi:MAG: tetratricopeptide repeat protein, partial [Bacteroidota bacterium]